MTLAKAFEEAYSRRHEATLWNWVYKSIALGLAPWNPGKITAFYDPGPSLSRFGPQVTFEVELLPNLPFVTYPDALRNDPDAMAFKMAEEAFQFYRNRPALPVDDHIVLGEE
jgi:hypothetical protein